jgi:hypothetical protein
VIALIGWNRWQATGGGSSGSPASVARLNAPQRPDRRQHTNELVVRLLLGCAELTHSGTLSTTAATVNAGEPLTVENAKDNHTGWRTLAVPKGQPPFKTQAGGAFSGKFYVGYPHGYYRIRYAGGTALAATVSKEVRDPRVNAMVFSWKVSPRKIHKGAYVTFSGVLKQKPGTSWKPFSGQLVYIVGRVKGKKTWYWYARARRPTRRAVSRPGSRSPRTATGSTSTRATRTTTSATRSSRSSST